MKMVTKMMVAMIAVLGALCSLLAAGPQNEVQDIITQKALCHKLATGESSVGYQGVRRTMKLMASTASSTMLMSESNPLLSNVVGLQKNVDEVKITYDLNSSFQCNVSCDILVDDVALSGPLTFSDDSQVGMVAAGNNRVIYWNAMNDWYNHQSDRVVARITATETDVPVTWAHITIAWAEWGGTDIDICGYWLDKSSAQVGWSHGSGSTDSTWRSVWKGDNTGSGPEYVLVAVAENEILDGVTSRKYRIHFNHYGIAPSTPKVRVKVSSNGTTKSTICSASARSRSAASTSDPYVTITFDEYGTPVSID